jgi:hypothetical protein
MSILQHYGNDESPPHRSGLKREDSMCKGRSWEGNESIRDELPSAGKTPQVPKGVKAVLTVSIDVTVGEYGQQGEWKPGRPSPYSVQVLGDQVTLRHDGSDKQLITFSREGLAAAIAILEAYKP